MTESDIPVESALTSEVLLSRCVLRIYAHDGSEPAKSFLGDRTCCDEWPECAHMLDVLDRKDKP